MRRIECAEFAPKEYLVYTIGMTPKQKGLFFRGVLKALDRGDWDSVKHLPFLRKPQYVRIGRVGIPIAVRRAVARRDEGRCVQCTSTENVEFDHIVPVVHGGETTVENIQLLCRRCNKTKGPQAHERRRMANG